jgi:Na+-transporting NADH:ubiquinone oxidoreductase subunit F
LSGGGSILSTETGFFTRREQQSQWRLGCQVKVREDMEIEIPEQILGVKKWECEVVSNRNVASFIKEFVIRLPEGEMLDFRSGGYIQIDVPPVTVDFSKDITVDDVYAGDWKSLGLLNLKMVNREYGFRAYSMANHPAEGNRIMLNVRIATPPWDRSRGSFMKVNPGICSSYIFSRKPGDKVMVSGPYGDFFLKDTHAEKIFIGGGAGMAPMRSHIFHLFKTLGTQDKVSFWYGARSAGEIFYEEAFREIEADFPNFTFHLALSEPKPEDHWTGYTGFIHQVLLDQYLKDHPEPEEAEYYLCGPPLMTAAAIRMLDNLGVSEDHILFDDFGG